MSPPQLFLRCSPHLRHKSVIVLLTLPCMLFHTCKQRKGSGLVYRMLPSPLDTIVFTQMISKPFSRTNRVGLLMHSRWGFFHPSPAQPCIFWFQHPSIGIGSVNFNPSTHYYINSRSFLSGQALMHERKSCIEATTSSTKFAPSTKKGLHSHRLSAIIVWLVRDRYHLSYKAGINRAQQYMGH